MPHETIDKPNDEAPREEPPVESPVWALIRTTCLSLGLNPNEPSHAAVICNNCNHYWDTKLKRNVGLHPQPPRSRRTTCERPFDCGDKAQDYKVCLKNQLKQLFPGPVRPWLQLGIVSHLQTELVVISQPQLLL